jgi:hypothetical protein
MVEKAKKFIRHERRAEVWIEGRFGEYPIESSCAASPVARAVHELLDTIANLSRVHLLQVGAR